MAIVKMWKSIGTFGPAYNPSTSLQQPTTKRQTGKKAPWRNVHLAAFTDGFIGDQAHQSKAKRPESLSLHN
jgi:hypothetical protein